MTRPLLVVYDITDDRRRQRLRARLAPMAVWIQRSAWVVPPAPGLSARWLLAMLRPLTRSGDRLRIYEVCPACLARARCLPEDTAALDWPIVRVADGT